MKLFKGCFLNQIINTKIYFKLNSTKNLEI